MLVLLTKLKELESYISLQIGVSALDITSSQYTCSYKTFQSFPNYKPNASLFKVPSRELSIYPNVDTKLERPASFHSEEI